MESVGEKRPGVESERSHQEQLILCQLCRAVTDVGCIELCRAVKNVGCIGSAERATQVIAHKTRECKMNDSSRFGEANQALLSANATRLNEQGAGMPQMPPGGQAAGGSGTAQQADVIASSLNSSSLNSSQGSQEGSAFNGGVEGGSNQCAPMLFPVPSFNSVFSMRLIDASGALFGVVGSLDADASPMRVPPQTGSFVFGPLTRRCGMMRQQWR